MHYRIPRSVLDIHRVVWQGEWYITLAEVKADPVGAILVPRTSSPSAWGSFLPNQRLIGTSLNTPLASAAATP
jgi:hypothetical protein